MALGVTDNPSAANVDSSELTTEQVRTILTQPLEQASVFLAAGPQIFDTDGSPIKLPGAPASVSDDIDWIGENEQITEVDPEFSEVSLLPSTMKSVKTITRYSNELARQSVVGLDAALQQRLVADVASKVDAQFLGNTGDGVTTPKGLFAYTNATDGVTEQTVTAWDLDAILAAQGAALAAHVNPDSLALFIRPADYMAIRGQKDGDGRYLFSADPTTGGLVVPLLGARAFITDRVPADSAAVVDMSQVAVARDLAGSVKVLDQTYADYDQQAIRVVSRFDMRPINPAAVILLTKSAE